MKFTRLGSTGLEVSRICVGCMSYGEPDRGGHPWTLGEDAAKPFIRRAIEAGINFFDTSNIYSLGSSEEILGKLLREYGKRDELVIATKVYGRMRPGPNGGGLSRKAIFTEVDHSLQRLRTDYIDLYQIHRWDPAVRIEETLEALHDVVQAGKARYIGASSMAAWQFCKALYTAKLNGWTSFVSMQDHYNLLNREEEKEMHPLCADQGIGVIPWSPLARGLLAREWRATTVRSATDEMATRLYGSNDAAHDKAIVDRVGAMADKRGLSRGQIALAWVLRNPLVTAPIVGATKLSHLEDAINAVEIYLSDDEARSLATQ